MLEKIIGVYCLKNTSTNEIYIGSSKDTRKRMTTHLRNLKLGKHYNKYIQKSYDEYGVDCFSFEVICVCEQHELLDKEQYYLDFHKPEFNISLTSNCPMGGRKHTEECKAEMSRTRKGVSRNLGMKHTEENKRKRSLARMGYKHSETTKNKMSDTAKRINSISRVDRTKSYKAVYDNRGNEFKTLVEASQFWNKSVQTVCDILKGRHTKTKEGVIFYYKENV